MSTSTALTAARYALLAAGMAAVASAARAKAPDTLDYQYLVFPSGCLDKFLGGDLLNEFCLKKTVSKVLGYGIIAGALSRGGIEGGPRRRARDAARSERG